MASTIAVETGTSSTEQFHIVVDALSLISIAASGVKMYLRYCPNNAQIAELRAILTEWRVFMATLTGPQRERFDREYPRYIAQMEARVGNFDMVLNSLAGDLRGSNAWNAYNPFAHLGNSFQAARALIHEADVDFRRTTASFRDSGRNEGHAVGVDAGRHSGPAQARSSTQPHQTSTTDTPSANEPSVADISNMRTVLMARNTLNYIRNLNMRNAVNGANYIINALIQSAQAGANARV
ncbi:hypothetical protein BN946_scf185043.g212 [Trametes cinnabarina]|uniref:Uncharacterized protein n=1 Tax=Pycnoporus cinnabarinus TaxID=5643 RepID=A0A060SIY8_PYCCI|nr:hypothetical protein BN946_scf185043.g212 [Trametes cinnabarina]